jgi:curved DNA-binding protein CbpA
MRNLYEILGILVDAKEAEIRAAYVAKVKETHPDAGGSSEAFNEVVLAYEILSDDYRRKQYDEVGRIDDPAKEISSGAVIIVEQLINWLVQQEDARYSDVVNIMCADISNALRSKLANIDILEKRKSSLLDLKDRFRPKASEKDSNFLYDILDRKIEALRNNIGAERQAIAQLNEATTILRGYDFIRDTKRQGKHTEFVDLSAFGRPVDPLINTEELFPEKQ